ncbi:Co2+/Mg2+ efflux protein ApaG [Crocinitomicaceae bacterium CZZ-1]|uniref:Co2+/Mg2+ efflux protein ApaG n=1 Tax=Taishania pollutisoli TaxID=2766479 RepID=A0A8J6P9U7_9FLAO|nr:Co2+/Mg2+ efflux protein ApaG [Taishania pollutisoli]MBC9811308.1 Co2+/Mg2+ efflux protein ApaG [Taishania pollutisoli]MBX2947777.1 Co2+/Mg2+ efflux protein ApaG [Crocinitomicaceae bacterium]NGF75090.1 Co2+/Mg2+ efflux protein ApaG [Fluviicola sp. SGL-29]
MNVAITEGVEIRVNVIFRPDLSQVENDSFFFNYEVFMENHNSFPVQLLYRNWYIFDSMNDASVVSGEGVIGEQPTLKSQDTYTYMSGCELYSEIGYMKGFYTFRNLLTGENFQVVIPQFDLFFPPRLN